MPLTQSSEWFIFDNALVLPEYLIEFELLREDNSNNKTERRKRGDPKTVAAEILGRELSTQELVDIRPMLRPLERFKMRVAGGDEQALEASMHGIVSEDRDDCSELGGWSSSEDASGSQGSKAPWECVVQSEIYDSVLILIIGACASTTSTTKEKLLS